MPRCDEDGTLGEKILVAIVEGVTPVLATIVIGKFFPQLLEPKKDEDEDR